MGGYKLQHEKTGKIIVNGLTRKHMTFETEDRARHFADSMTRSSHLDGNAFNSVRPSNYKVIAA